MNEYIKKSEAVDVIVKYPYNISGKTATAIKMIEDLPSADVVPKSEEGTECPTCHGTGRIGTTDWLTKNISKKQLAEEKAKAIAEHEQYIKTEFARKIFAEIDKKLDKVRIKYRNQLDSNGVIYTNYARVIIAELKKKYTEGDQ